MPISGLGPEDLSQTPASPADLGELKRLRPSPDLEGLPGRHEEVAEGAARAGTFQLCLLGLKDRRLKNIGNFMLSTSRHCFLDFNASWGNCVRVCVCARAPVGGGGKGVSRDSVLN